MNKQIIDWLKKINSQEELILNSGQKILDLYTTKPNHTIVDKDKIIRPKCLIDIMRQPRFAEIPNHTHNYLDVIYVCSGSTHHIIDGQTPLTMETGDLLFLRPGTYHSIEPAGYDDIAIHFMILPEFLHYPLTMITEDTILRRFIHSCITDLPNSEPYLHFHLQDMDEAKNLLENMTRTLLKRNRNSRRILQATMGVLFLELTNRTYKITVGSPSTYEQDLVLKALSYIEENYQTASLEKFCEQVQQPSYYISRLMKRYSPYTFTKYLQRRKMLQAAHLLSETQEPIEQIIIQVGYENSSHFYRLFRAEFLMTPKEYRKKHSVFTDSL